MFQVTEALYIYIFLEILLQCHSFKINSMKILLQLCNFKISVEKFSSNS